MNRAAKSLIGLFPARLPVLSALLFTFCFNEYNNPMDSRNPNYVPPQITIDTSGAHVGNGDTISGVSATITVTGNRDQSVFRAKIDSSEWSDWGVVGMFEYDSLTSGAHAVIIESKYDGWDYVSTDSIVFFVQSGINSARALTAFSFTTPAVTGTIDESDKTVALTVPFGTSVTALVATFAISGSSVKVGSTVQVSGTTPNNFTSPVTYTVTAADGSTQAYVVTVTVSASTAKAITAFSFATPAVTGTIDESKKTVSLTVPHGADVTVLVPTITHTGASVSPASGIAQDFSSPVTYTVTAADGSTQDYVVTVKISPNTSKTLTAFSFTTPAATGTINESAKTIAVTVPHGTNVTALVATITHTGASISPASGVAQDFSDPVTYTVTAADGSKQAYEVTVTVSSSTAKALSTFNFTTPAVTGAIDESAKTVSLTVPHGADVTALVPTITHTGASVSPASGVARNFSSPVTYTVTAADGSTQAYVVTVSVATAQVFVIAASVTGSGGTISPSGNVNVTQGTSQTFTITPGVGYSINSVLVDGVADTEAKNAKQKTFTNVTAAHTITVSFAIHQYTLATVTTADIGTVSGWIIRNPSQDLYDSNTAVTLTAPVDARYTFTGWSGGGLSGTANPATISVRQNTTVTAAYEILKYALTTAVTPSGGGTVTCSPAPGPYSHGTAVTLTATPASGYLFGSWSGDASGSANPVSVTMDGAKSVTATFTLQPPTVTDPSDATVDAGQTASFSVTAQGAGTLSYQWEKKPSGGSFGTITGATSASYTTPATAIADNSAAYRCVVTNGGGSVTSNAAILTVRYVQITTQPAAQTAVDNTSVTFTVAAIGNPTPAYQWQMGTESSYTPISGATNANHTFIANCPGHFGMSFRCVVTAASGVSQTSSAAALTIVLKDGDNNMYNIVKIGDQFWTVENLRTTKYNDGTAIPHVTDGTEWSTLSTPAYCWYNNSTDASYRQKWGALYNWYAVNTGKLAPSGWDVPTDADWKALSDYLGGESVAGGKMKESGTGNWSSPNTGATNSSGFSALPGGGRNFGGSGDFYSVGYLGSWWSATEYDASYAWSRSLYCDDESLFRDSSSRRYGFSVRLLRD